MECGEMCCNGVWLTNKALNSGHIVKYAPNTLPLLKPRLFMFGIYNHVFIILQATQVYVEI